MKVEGTIGNASNMKGSIVAEERRAVDFLEKDFQANLQSFEAQKSQGKIKELMENIFEQGKKVGDKVDIKELNYYKKLISEFLYEVINSSSKFSKQSFLDRRGRHRVYAIIKKVDNELELLTQEVLKEEKNNIGILKSLEDIRGLILDVMM